MAAIAALIVFSATAGITAPAATAAPDTSSREVTVKVIPAAWVKALIDAYSFYRNATSGGISVGEATRRILAAIDGAKTEIINHIDRVAAAQVRACATAAVIDFADIEKFTPDTLQAFARDATYCSTLTESLLRTTTEQSVVDNLGAALNAIGPVALIARTRAGLSDAALKPVLVNGNGVLLNKPQPTCLVEPDEEWLPPGLWQTTGRVNCQAFNGDVGTEYVGDEPPKQLWIYWEGRPPVTHYICSYCGDQAIGDAARNTSWTAANAVLALLGS